MLTPAQQAIIKADILANPDLNSQPNNGDGASEIARLYNLAASPSFTVWRTLVSIKEVGDKFNGTELAGMTTANQTRLQTIALFSAGGINASLLDRRQMFDDIFSGAGGVTTRANLLILWKRLATRLEKLFATGTGSDASPATMTFEGGIGYQDILAARNS